MDQALRQADQQQGRDAWWTIPEQLRLHDSMLHRLYKLAQQDAPPGAYSNLGQLAEHYAGLPIDKEDP